MVIEWDRFHAKARAGLYKDRELRRRGQIAQSVEHSPEKAGVVGSNPTLSTQNIF